MLQRLNGIALAGTLSMMRRFAIVIATMLAVVTAGTSVATEIYKWTDEEGNVHYVDRPTGAETEERLDIISKPTNRSEVQARVQARREARAAAEEEAAASQPEGPTEEELRAEARERERKCATYKARLQKFLTSRRLYREDEDGERIYLDEEETLAARERVQKQVEEYCDS